MILNRVSIVFFRSSYGKLQTESDATTLADKENTISNDAPLLDTYDKTSTKRDAEENNLSDTDMEISDDEYDALVESVRDAVESLLNKREAQRREIERLVRQADENPREADSNRRESFNPLRRLIEFIKKHMPKALKTKPTTDQIVGVVKRCYGDKRSCVGLNDALEGDVWQQVTDEEMNELMN